VLPGAPEKLHGTLDAVMANATRWPRLYPDGFGDRARLERLVEAIRDFEPGSPPPGVTLHWTGPFRRSGPVRVRSGAFRSPVAHWLAPECAEVPVKLTVPAGESFPCARVCVLFAATGEEGFRPRRGWAMRLAEHGIGSLLFENPYYGHRRPSGQRAAALRSVADQFAMNLSTVQEGRALVHWLREQGVPRIGVSGYSQGGMMAAFVGALTPFAVATVPRGTGAAARPVFTEMELTKFFFWRRLAEQLEGREQARRYLGRCLDPVDVCRFPPPVDPRAAILVASRQDRFVPADEVRRLHRHWPGSELRWLQAGHVSGALYRRTHLRAMVDALQRVDPEPVSAAPPGGSPDSLGGLAAGSAEGNRGRIGDRFP
jgi:hypothetical protein